MSIKSLINALFQMSGSRAMPVTNSSAVVIDGDTFTAPSAGYVHYRRNSNGYGFVGIRVNALVNQIVFSSEQGGWKTLYVPVNKGDSVTFSGSNSDPLGSAGETKTFFKLVGGAKSLLSLAQSWIRGGVPCLI